VSEGAQLIDVGGYSSRPGADEVPADEEWRRVRLGVGTVRRLAPRLTASVDPVRRVLAPRFIGAFVAMPVLATIFSAVGIMGAWFVGVEMIGTDGGAFWSQMQSAVDVWHDIGNGFIKSVVFGVAVALVALFNGYAARPTPEGVSRATTSTVVVASLLVLGLDFIMTAWMFTTV